ncbi:Glycosyl transferase family 2 [Nitrosospira sp. Nsp11]|uniref:glycosyltransferase family 2 protein n=1 Tax=Nitrosospira sp. Nsp11 TaxID=1855338 RepID=UPI00091A6DEC|nr:glycosyltransferase family 2 protein [Nitrosospira sp. Nsp11]SHL69590.1 Glycosyl transferase family 2 [Nitrosospira sp. Nsp11]
MNKRLSLSVALASYNGERYIREQLDSIARQTRLPDELIISDDASTDATANIALCFAQNAPFPVRFQRNSERLGSTRNFESAIRACNGDIIFLCDQDDVWYPDKIAVIEERFNNASNIGAVFTDADIVDENLHSLAQHLWKASGFSQQEQAEVTASDALGVLLRHPVATGATMAFRSIYRDLILPIPEITWHDAWISLLISTTSRLSAISTPLIAYRQHSSNQIGIRRDQPGKSCAAIYGPRVLFYELARSRLLDSVGCFCNEEEIHRLNEALLFFRARAALPDARLHRLPAALYELLALRYHRYARGLGSFFNDLRR